MPEPARASAFLALAAALPLSVAALSLGHHDHAPTATAPLAAVAVSPGGSGQIGAAVAASTEMGSEVTDVRRAKDGLFYVDVLVNGQSVRFLVDTGANMVVLTGADAARLGIRAEVNPFGPQMSTAAGRAPMAWTRLGHIALAGREVRDLRAAVMPSGLPVSLLGQNMLSKLASVTIEGDRLRLR